MKTYFRYLLSLVVLLVGATGLAFSQNIITGTVEDADGPLIGASVLVQGTTRTTPCNLFMKQLRNQVENNNNLFY